MDGSPQSGFLFYSTYNKTDATTGALNLTEGISLFYRSGLYGLKYAIQNLIWEPYLGDPFGNPIKVIQMTMVYIPQIVFHLHLVFLQKVIIQFQTKIEK